MTSYNIFCAEASKMKDLHQPPDGCHLNLKLSAVEDISADDRYLNSNYFLVTP